MAKVYQEIADKIQAMRNCNKSGNGEWFTKHHDAIDDIIRKYAPSGSGFDAGTEFDVCTNVDHGKDRLIFETSFHHMDQNGYYREWTNHKIIVTPALARGFNMRITGQNRNDIKEYIAETFYQFLAQEI